MLGKHGEGGKKDFLRCVGGTTLSLAQREKWEGGQVEIEIETYLASQPALPASLPYSFFLAALPLSKAGPLLLLTLLPSHFPKIGNG